MNLALKSIRIIFWSCFTLIGYVYCLYPLFIHVVSRLSNRSYTKGDIEPTVSIIIAAFNEEQHIVRKIENTLQLDYPRDKLELIVGSDGSTDRTNDMVKSYANQGVRLMAFAENRGKTMVQNDCVLKASHDIIVFMDAASFCEQDCVRKLVSVFADSRVGAVAGRVVFIQDKDTMTTESQGIYWRYEQFLKRAESSLGSLVGVDGPLYAIRRELYTQLDADMMSDFITPLLIVKGGHAVVYEPDAVTYEEATKKSRDEFMTRSRIVIRGFTALARYPELLNLRKHPVFAWQILSHKVLRWLAGPFFLAMTGCSAFLATRFLYAVSLFGSLVLVLLAYLGFRTQGHPRKFFAIPYYFVLVNLAAMQGAINFMRGKRVISWKPVRE